MDKYTIIVIFSLTFIMVYIVYVVKSTNKGNITSNFTEKLVLLSSIFIPIGIYLTYTIFSRQIREMRVNATFRTIDRGWIAINKSFIENHDKCPNLIDSLAYDWQINTLGKKTYKLTQEEDDWTASNYVSNCIFQALEDFLTSEGLDETEPEAWLATFLQWTSSNILHNNWLVLKFNYADTTQKFGDYLFEVASKNRNQIKNGSDIYKLAVNITDGDKFKQLSYEREQES